MLVIGLTAAAAAVALAVLVLRRFFAVVQVVGISMEPTFHTGDRLLVRRRRLSRLRVGDVVVFERPPGWPVAGEFASRRQWMVKRVAALPGDPVPAQVTTAVAERRVGQGRLVVLGDNPAFSFDSRQFGLLPADRLLGVVLRRMR